MGYENEGGVVDLNNRKRSDGLCRGTWRGEPEEMGQKAEKRNVWVICKLRMEKRENCRLIKSVSSGVVRSKRKHHKAPSSPLQSSL